MEPLDMAYNGGAMFVVGLALLILYKVIDGKIGNGKNGKNPSAELTVSIRSLNSSIKEVGAKIDKQTDTLGAKLDKLCINNAQHDAKFDAVNDQTVSTLTEIRGKVEKCESGIAHISTVQEMGK